MSSKFKIDINADLGEGLNNEHLLLPYLSSCNIACGGHAGDLYTMTKVVRLAKTNNVKIGAHPSFPDKVNFGRKEIKLSAEDLFSSLKQQIENLNRVTAQEGAVMHHIKPHGALYNLAAKDETIAMIIIDVMQSLTQKLKLYAPYQSVIANLGKLNNIEVIYEGFADRNYNNDLSLVSRENSDAIITDKKVVFNHVFKMITAQKIDTIQGVEIPFIANTICVHGDTRNVQEILQFLHSKLRSKNIQIH